MSGALSPGYGETPGPTAAAEVGAVRDEPRGDAVGVSQAPRAAALPRPHLGPPQVWRLHLILACGAIPTE